MYGLLVCMYVCARWSKCMCEVGVWLGVAIFVVAQSESARQRRTDAHSLKTQLGPSKGVCVRRHDAGKPKDLPEVNIHYLCSLE